MLEDAFFLPFSFKRYSKESLLETEFPSFLSAFGRRVIVDEDEIIPDYVIRKDKKRKLTGVNWDVNIKPIPTTTTTTAPYRVLQKM